MFRGLRDVYTATVRCYALAWCMMGGNEWSGYKRPTSSLFAFLLHYTTRLSTPTLNRPSEILDPLIRRWVEVSQMFGCLVRSFLSWQFPAFLAIALQTSSRTPLLVLSTSQYSLSFPTFTRTFTIKLPSWVLVQSTAGHFCCYQRLCSY